MGFIKYKLNEIIIIIVLSLLFGLIMILYNTPLEGIVLTAGIIIFLGIIYFSYSMMIYKKVCTVQEENLQLKEEIQDIRNEKIEYQSEIESYFLLWVHQMKTPITASKLLLEAEDIQTISQMRHEILQIDNYTNLALSYLKLMNEKTDMVFMEVRMDDLITPLIKRYSIQFIHNDTKLHYEKIYDSVLTDAKWTSVMIEQILNNALKYARGKNIWIKYSEAENILSVKDDGIGINTSDLPKIFEKGFSGYNGRLNDKSSGIGLYIVKTIARRMNVSVSVESELGKGTTFHMKFPNLTNL
ncbi:sensor histidine kinase [Macrococcoides caseolyticum]|uniref:histidine kinase n=1 Tax=Macrococcoides caseolyticum TaxID=69966 RepID=A0A855GIW4_9STAP|nr:sensor histidine kinase [Macrococcus caseolyticus]PKE06878.1 sensor histidine kinase [Macrococcus caseolyticus]PKE21509.1 sensor histidine kinase [Macrococcus caseolyticus]PKE24075.1 sensor histidine kinase [Macrococcus caseolyticus]PKE25839.1 sensor histidine kinase [Macrococcus caseolyticus]PKE53302.1 sensor histidine kinase [Macrococcus caseolyticus]